jgi:multimeric flavodoxin WrbA
VDTEDRRGALGFLASGKEASQKKLATIKEGKLDPASFDVVVLGTPVWSGTMSSPTRAYISKHREKFNKVAFFCTSGGSDSGKVFEAIKDLCGKEPVVTLVTTKKRMKSEEYSQDVEQFAKKIAQPI